MRVRNPAGNDRLMGITPFPVRPSGPMPPQVKQRIKVAHPNLGYHPGRSYLVARVDNSNSALVAIGAEGNGGNWISRDLWADCGTNSNWSWLKGRLAGEAMELLGAVDGLEMLRLKDGMQTGCLTGSCCEGET